jgi:DNA segregation ATPase FtsK/SpoIIIE, S-DNA-T family
MATWGPSKKPARRTTRSSARPAPPPGAAVPAVPDSGTRRDQASTELRDAVSGRENEFAGIALIGVGALAALAVYFELAGPLGSAIEQLVGWFTGLGRYLVPPALIGVGIALIHKARSPHPFRLALGWGLAALACLGVLHVVRGPEKILDNFTNLGKAGGWLGALVGEPLRTLLGEVGAMVLLTVAFLGGVMLISGLSVKSMFGQTARGVGAVAVPLGRKARQALGDMATLRSDRETTGDFESIEGATADTAALPAPSVFDHTAYGDDFAGPAAARRRPAVPSDPTEEGGDQTQGELDLGPGARPGQWALPPRSYLALSTAQQVNAAEVEARGRTLVDSLNSHGVEVRLLGQTVGPTVTRYELELGTGVKVARVTNLNRDIAYAMAAVDVRILAPIPGRSAIGVEVPNHTRQLVSLGDVMSSAEARAATHPLDVAIGKDIAGRAVFLNLATTPHLLIAGATGAGKSSGINCVITSLLMRTTPDQVRLILIDPKQVEMGQYNRLPHLLTQPVTNPKKAANALAWAVKEMERRYDLLFEVGFRDITGYNAAYDRGELQDPGVERTEGASEESAAPERLPYIVVVVDELNDLMMVAARDVEESITRIAQKARAVGIHLIVATQRPSVNVITGVIKANVPARIAFAVSSLTDSRVILDQPGAEKLVGKGDMLLLPGNSNVPQRVQGCFVSEDEVRKVVAHWRRQAPDVIYVSGVEGDDDAAHGSGSFGGNGADDDEDEGLMRQAMELVVRSQLGSTSMLQRKLKVGFARAGRIMDLLEQRGVVGPSEGSKARAVLMTVEEYELLQDSQRR